MGGVMIRFWGKCQDNSMGDKVQAVAFESGALRLGM